MVKRTCSNCRYFEDGICYHGDNPKTPKEVCKFHKTRSGQYDQRTDIHKYFTSNQHELKEVPEHHKWLANDYLRLIGKYYPKDDNMNHEVLSKSVIMCHQSFWNKGDPYHTIDETMPEKQRQNIYWKKTLSAYNNLMISWKRENAEQQQHFQTYGKMDVEYYSDIHQQNRDTAMLHAVVEWVKQNKTKLINETPGDTYYERTKSREKFIKAFDMVMLENVSRTEAIRKVNIRNRSTFDDRYRRILGEIKKHEKEIQKMADRIYEEKFGIF